MGALASPPTLVSTNALRANMAALEIQPNLYLKAIAIVSLTYVTANTTYKANLMKLRTDAANLFRGITMLPDSGSDSRDAVIQTVLAWQAAYTSDATIPNSIETLLNTGRSLLGMTEPELNKMIYLLQWKMSI